MADIFISYAREDEKRVQQLVHDLEEQGWSVFWDRHIPAGQTWRSCIGQALSDARCVIAVWTRHSIASQWVIEEAEAGQRRGILVPVRLEAIEPPFGFRGIQAGDLTEWQPGSPSPHLSQLVNDIKAVLGPRGASSEAVFERESKYPKRREKAADQKPKTLPRQINKTLLVGLILIIGIGYLGYVLTHLSSRPTAKTEETASTGKYSASEEHKGQGESTRSSRGSDSVPLILKPAQGSSLAVTGKGTDLYYVYDADGQKRLNFKSTGQITELLPGTYQVALNDIWKRIDVKANQQTVVESGSLVVSGSGTDLYYVYDADGQKRLNFKSTGRITELLPGTYQVELNDIWKRIDVKANQQTVVESGSLVVSGSGADLYYVYDADGQKRLNFKSTGRITELLPGTYQVELNETRVTIQIKAKERTTL